MAPRVERVAAIVARLQPKLGRQVRVSSRLENVLAFLEPNGAAPDVALKTLAQALHASLERTPTGILLDRTADDLRAADRARISDREGWIQGRIDRIVAYRASRLKGGSPQDTILQEVERASRVSDDVARGLRRSPDPFFATELLPSEDLLLALVGKVGKRSLASVPIGETQVWEDRRSPGARPLPAYQDALDAYDAKMSSFRGTPIFRSTRAKLDDLGMGSFFGDWGEEALPPVRLRLQVRAEEALVFASLQGYDASGHQQTMATTRNDRPGRARSAEVQVGVAVKIRPGRLLRHSFHARCRGREGA